MKKKKLVPNIFKPVLSQRKHGRRNSDHEIFMENAQESILALEIFPKLSSERKARLRIRSKSEVYIKMGFNRLLMTKINRKKPYVKTKQLKRLETRERLNSAELRERNLKKGSGIRLGESSDDISLVSVVEEE